MTEKEIKTIIKRELPRIIAEDPTVRDFILRTVSDYYTPKNEFQDRFDRILTELQRDREEQARKWDEHKRQWEEFTQEQARKWDEHKRQWEDNNRKWEEQNNFNKQLLEEIKRLDKKYDSSIGALGSRWGLYSEASFRNGLKGILQNSFGVEVININDFDHEGEVFGRPDQVEIDVIIKNGLVILCEIKSSISKAEMYVFDRKAIYYEKHHQRKVNRKLVISPMVDQRALPVAQNLGIEIYSYAEDIENL